MPSKVSIIELERMTPKELGRELRNKQAEMAKTRLGLTMGSEKNHAKYNFMKKDAARMTMVLQAMMKKGMKAPSAETPVKASNVAKKTVKKVAPKASPKKTK